MADIIKSVFGGMFDSTSVEETVNGFPRGNKAVDSSFFAKMISCFYKNGIFGDDSFAVTPDAGLRVKISSGIAWIRGYMAWQKSDVVLTLAAGKTYAVLLRLNTASGEFSIVATEDVTDVPVVSESICDLVLAYVSPPSGTVAMTAEMIDDRRGDPELCGHVTSTVDALGYVDSAQNAQTAQNAQNAEFAENANTAQSAQSAETAQNAQNAENAQSAESLGGYSAAEFLLKSGGEMSGTLTAAAETEGASVVRNIGYGTSLPASLADGEIFILLS